MADNNFDIGGGILKAATSLTTGLVGNIIGAVTTSKANKANQQLAREQMDIQRDQLNYQKYLNNNQIQMQASDAQKAGINPMAMNSGSLSTGSYSNVSGEQTGFTPDAISADTDFLSSVLEMRNSNKQHKDSIDSQESMNDSNNATAEKNAETQAETQKEIAKMQIEAETKRQEEQIRSEENIEALRLSEDARQFDESHGLDRERFEEDKYQSDRSYELSEAEYNRISSSQNIIDVTSARKLYDSLNSGVSLDDSGSEIAGIVEDALKYLSRTKEAVSNAFTGSDDFEDFYKRLTGHSTSYAEFHYSRGR